MPKLRDVTFRRDGRVTIGRTQVGVWEKLPSKRFSFTSWDDRTMIQDERVVVRTLALLALDRKQAA